MKKNKAVIIQIPDPCRVPWQEMTRVDEYRHHCASCATVITDFSEMTDLEIASFIQANTGKKMCGKFNASQLNRPVALLPEQKRKAVWWKAALLLPFTLWGKNSAAQTNNDYTTLTSSERDSVERYNLAHPQNNLVENSDTVESNVIVENELTVSDSEKIEFAVYQDSLTTEYIIKNQKGCFVDIHTLGPWYGNVGTIPYPEESKDDTYISLIGNLIQKLGLGNVIPKEDTEQNETAFTPPPPAPEPKPENPLPPETPEIAAITPPELPRFTKRSTTKN